MAALPPIIMSYADLYNDPANNPFGTSPDDRALGYASIFAFLRVNDRPPSANELEKEMLTEFHEPIGVIGTLVEDGTHESGILKCVHALQVYPGQPGKPSPDRSRAFAYVDDVDGIDITTIALDEDMYDRDQHRGFSHAPPRSLGRQPR